MIFPIPKSEKYFNGYYCLKNDNVMSFDLIEFYRYVKSGNSEFRLIRESRFGNEEYLIQINENEICITFSGDESLFRAVTTIRQMISEYNGCLKYTEIHDFPDFERRGYMLDISRGRIPKPETIKKIIDCLATLKYNEFQLYMDNFCFKYKNFTKYTQNFDCLTDEDIVEIKNYCKERFIDFVPCQNSLGHMRAWLNQKEFSHLEIKSKDDRTNTLNPLLPETLSFMDDIYGSLLPLFDSEYVNIGLDEAEGLGKYQTKDFCDKFGCETLFINYLAKLNALTEQKYGKKVMFWADMLNRYETIYQQIPKGAIALEWGYDLIQCQKMTEHCIDLKKKNIPFYVCPSCNIHNSFTGRTDVMLFNIRTAGEVGKKYGARGFLLTDWGDNGHPQFWVWSMAPMALGAQYAWNSGEKQPGWKLKKDFIKAAWEFTDKCFFGGKSISKILELLGNYYLLEREREHNATVTSHSFSKSLIKDEANENDDVFTFKNIIEYVTHYTDFIEKAEIDNDLKAQIIINSNMVILASHFGILRLDRGQYTNKDIQNLINKIREMKCNYLDLWCKYNFKTGSEIVLNNLDEKIRELNAINAEEI